MLRRTLSLAGYDIQLAESGAEALAQAGSGAPDAVVLDIGLPDVRGEGTRIARSG